MQEFTLAIGFGELFKKWKGREIYCKRSQSLLTQCETTLTAFETAFKHVVETSRSDCLLGKKSIDELCIDMYK